jgi:hypothetical protein
MRSVVWCDEYRAAFETVYLIDAIAERGVNAAVVVSCMTQQDINFIAANFNREIPTVKVCRIQGFSGWAEALMSALCDPATHSQGVPHENATFEPIAAWPRERLLR